MNQTLSIILSLCTPALLATLALLVRKYLAWIKTSDMPSQVQSALSALGEISLTCVAHAWQTVVEDLKDPEKPGVWNDRAKADVKASVSADVAMLAASALRTLREVGMSEQSIQSLLDKTVERAVADLKSRAVIQFVTEPMEVEHASN